MGDVIICLPIAKYYHDKGYEIVWPVLGDYYDAFRDIDYVQAIRLDCDINESALAAKKISRLHGCQEIDLCFGFPYSTAHQYHSNINFAKNFVEAKYKLANTPLTERWNLSYNRDTEKESSLYNQVVKSSDYKLVHEESSAGKHFHAKGENIVRVKKLHGYNIFNWMKIIEGATEIHCVESALCNLVESEKRLKGKIKKYITAREGAKGWSRTTLQNNWIVS